MKKTGDRNFILRAAAAAAFATLASMAMAQPQVQGQVAVQQGPALKDMNAPRVPGDDRLDIQLPNGCQIKASATSGCDVIRCKAEEPIAINSARGITTAKTVATAKAKKALSDKLGENFSASETVNQVTEQLQREGLNAEATSSTLTTINTQISGNTQRLLVGVAIEEDGVAPSGAAGQFVAYVIAKTSCRTQAAAAQNAAGMARAAAGQSPMNPQQPAAGNAAAPMAPAVTQNPATLNPYQRRSGGLD